MFNELINTPVSPLTIDYFNLNQKINRLSYEPDYSLSSLGFALFKPRIPDYKGICGRFGITGPVEAQIQDVLSNLNEGRKMPKEQCLATPCLWYHQLTNKEDYLTVSKTLNEHGMEELQQVKAYIKQELNITQFCAMIDKDTNLACVFVPSCNAQLYHLVIAFIASLFPTPFANKPLTPEEVNILKTLTNKSSGKFVSALSNALNIVKSDVLSFELSKCFQGFRQRKIEKAERDVRSLQDKINEVFDQYRRYSEMLENAVVTYEGMKALNGNGNDEQEKEAIDYIASCPRLHNVEYDSGNLEFNVDTILTNFDVLKWRNAVANQDIYNNYRLDKDNPFANLQSRKMLLDALFGSTDPELHVKLRAHFSLDMARSYMNVFRGDNYAGVSEELMHCLTNPHFKLHGCPGSNREQVISCLRSADIISAIECCIAATGSVNIGETEMTFRPFIAEILSSKDRIIKRKDGVDMTPAEALLWLLKKQGEKAA